MQEIKNVFLLIIELNIQHQRSSMELLCEIAQISFGTISYSLLFKHHLQSAWLLHLQNGFIITMRLNQHSPATSIYLEQMGNHIELGQGYNQLRKHLFRQLFHSTHEDASSEDRLSESIVSFLTASLSKTVNFHKSEQTYRIVQVVQDLLTYAQEIMSPAMHHEPFLSALVYAATPKIVTFNSLLDAEIRNHILSLFYFWFNRYGRDEEGKYELFVQAYKELKDKKLVFPSNIKITPSDYFKKELEKSKIAEPGQVSNSQANRIVLADIEDFTSKTESLIKENIRSVANTEYVRLIKHKSKVLYEFTTKPNEFTPTEKNLVKDLYKRLRNLLKEVQKMKEVSLQTKKSQQTEKQYVQQKMTPKKSATEASPEQPKSQKQLKLLPSPSQKKSSEKKVQPQTFDLLDFSGPVSSPLKAQPQLASTPKKSSEKKMGRLEVDLLGNTNTIVEQEEEFVDGILVDTSETMSKPQEQKALFQVFLTPNKHNNEEDAGLLAKNSSEKSDEIGVSFQNEKKVKNPYQFIPNDLDLTPTSSNQEKEEKVPQKQGFSLFGLLNFNQSKPPQQHFDSDDQKHYDLAYKKQKSSTEKTPKKTQSFTSDLVKEIQIPMKNPIDSPNYKPVAPIIYDQVYYTQLSPQKSQEQSKLSFTPQKPTKESELDVEITIGNKSGEKIKVQE